MFTTFTLLIAAGVSFRLALSWTFRPQLSGPTAPRGGAPRADLPACLAKSTSVLVLPLVSVAISLRGYWREIGGARIRWGEVMRATRAAATLKNMDGGQAQGCNFEVDDRYSDRRRWLHQAVMFGFLLRFAATSAGTILHYVFAIG